MKHFCIFPDLLRLSPKIMSKQIPGDSDSWFGTAKEKNELLRCLPFRSRNARHRCERLGLDAVLARNMSFIIMITIILWFEIFDLVMSLCRITYFHFHTHDTCNYMYTFGCCLTWSTVTNCFFGACVVSDILDLSQVLVKKNPRNIHIVLGKPPTLSHWKVKISIGPFIKLLSRLFIHRSRVGGFANFRIRPRSYKLNGHQKLMPWPILIFSPLRLNTIILSQHRTKGIIGQQKMAKDVGGWFSTHTLED